MAAMRCFKIHPDDNVATMLDDAHAGQVTVIGDRGRALPLRQPIGLGHKIALADIPQGQPVIKFGVAIGRASQDIQAGEWVHLHNLTSDFDARSQTLDLHTGAATDTRYE